MVIALNIIGETGKALMVQMRKPRGKSRRDIKRPSIWIAKSLVRVIYFNGRDDVDWPQRNDRYYDIEVPKWLYEKIKHIYV